MRMLGRNRVALALGAVIASLAAAMAAGVAQGAQKVGYVENVHDPEDLVQLPGTGWVVASGRKPAGSDQPGHLYLIDAQTGRSQIVYPAAEADAPTHELDAACSGPPDPRNFEAHGLGLRAGTDGRSQLYVVNHAFATGGREAIELFYIDASGDKPTVTWSDCVPAPPNAWFNDVVALPDGGFAATNFMDPGDKATGAKLRAGAVTGNVLEWHEGVGFKAVPNSQMSGTNGIEIDPEERHYFVSAWGSKELIRIARDTGERVAAPAGILVDNSAWGSDGRLIVVGQALPAGTIDKCLADPSCPIPFKAIAFDPASLRSETLIDEQSNNWAATSPRPVNGELWIGAQRTDRIVRYTLDRSDTVASPQ